MVIKNYSVSLEENIVDKAKEIFKKKGIKLSPLINQYLKKLIEEEINGIIR